MARSSQVGLALVTSEELCTQHKCQCEFACWTRCNNSQCGSLQDRSTSLLLAMAGRDPGAGFCQMQPRGAQLAASLYRPVAWSSSIQFAKMALIHICTGEGQVRTGVLAGLLLALCLFSTRTTR